MKIENDYSDNDISVVPWKAYLTLTAESILTFYLSTFCLAMYFIHQGPQWVIESAVLVLIYLFIIFACAKRIFQKLSIAALMIVIPIAPFLALATVVSLIPILEFFR